MLLLNLAGVFEERGKFVLTGLAKLFEGISSLLWPILVAALIYSFRDVIKELFATAKSRKFTIKVFDQELTMEEVNDQQAQLVTDVQTRLLVLEKRMEELQPGHPSEPRTVAVPPPVRSILWVDDNPRNNAILSQRFSELGIQVVTALSTASAIAECNRQRYDRIITDMGRKEGGAYNSTAGLDLIRQIRALEPAIPIVVYCSAGAARRYRGEALAAGAIEITASPTTLIDALNIDPKQTGNI